MSAYESWLLIGGLLGGMLLGWILRGIIVPYTASGTISIDSTVTCTSTGITVTGSAVPDTGSRVIRMWTYLAPAATTTMPSTDSEPPTGSQVHEPQSGTYSLTHTVSAAPSGEQRIFVFVAFGTHNHQFVNFTCGSGSNAVFKIAQAVPEPAARQYRLTAPDAAGPGAPTELRQALPQGEVILAFDPLRAGNGEAVWSEETPAGTPARWRLTLRKVGRGHVAALELVSATGPALVWRCLQWHFFAGSRFVADSARRTLPSLEVRPA